MRKEFHLLLHFPRLGLQLQQSAHRILSWMKMSQGCPLHILPVSPVETKMASHLVSLPWETWWPVAGAQLEALKHAKERHQPLCVRVCGQSPRFPSVFLDLTAVPDVCTVLS